MRAFSRSYASIPAWKPANTASVMLALVWSNWTKRLPCLGGYRLAGEPRSEQKAAPAADFEGSLQQVGNKLVLKQKLALKKRIYRAADWEGFRAAVNAYKSFADYLIVKL